MQIHLSMVNQSGLVYNSLRACSVLAMHQVCCGQSSFSQIIPDRKAFVILGRSEKSHLGFFVQSWTPQVVDVTYGSCGKDREIR